MGYTQCKTCDKEIYKRMNYEENKSYYCSKACRGADKELSRRAWTAERRAQQSERNSGINNPNYGNTWSANQKQLASESTRERFANNTELRFACGASNRGAKFSPERIKLMHQNRTRESYQHPHSQLIRDKIGIKSKEKWTPEFKEEYRRTMEDKGYWIPVHLQDPYKIYYKEANWLENMISYFSTDEQASLLKYGLFNAKTNSKGWVRDHIVSRKIGYAYDIPPCIINHPANLQFISHSENIKKGFTDSRLTDLEKEHIITTLLNKIENYTNFWQNQNKCITYINERRPV